MGEEEESGGVQALRAWAGEAVGRVKALLPAPDTVVKPSRAHDDSVTELDALSHLLDHDPPLRSSVSLWLGGALTLRHAAGGGTPEDRDRARGLLRDVRDPATRTGAAASVEDRRWAALFLLTHAMPLQEMLGGLAPEPDATAMFDMIMREGPRGMAAFAAELQELVTDAAELPLPPETLRHLRQVRDLYARPSADGMADLFDSLIPDDGLPGTDQMRQMMGTWLTTMTGGTGPKSGTGTMNGPGTKSGSGSTNNPGTTNGPSPKSGSGTKSGSGAAPGAGPRVGDAHATPAPSGRSPADAGTPAGPRTPEDFRRLIAAWQAVHTTSVDFLDHAGGGDPAALDQQLGRLREALDGLPDGMPGKDALQGQMAMLLNLSDGAGGTLQDQALGVAHTRTVTDYFRRQSERSVPMADGFAIMADALDLMTDVRAAGQAEDVERLSDLLPRAEALADTVPEDHDFRAIALATRAMARLVLGWLTKERELLLRGFADFEDARTAAAHSSLPIGDEELEAMMPALSAMRSYLDGDTTNLPDGDVPPPDAPADQLHTAANRLGIRYSVTEDPADLDAAIDTLERLREHIRQGRAPRVAAQSLWTLAESYRARWHREQSESDADAATDAANEALATLAADVLLQHGAEHRLTTARTGASLGVRAALWAAAHERVDDAVAALELGRALVLQAAATSRAVPDLLEERGHPRLAAAWRESGASDTDELPAELPSTLRREALEALGYRERGGLLGTPTLRELADGVGEADADALIYLVPGSDGAPGMVLAVGPEIGIGVGGLPMLTEAENGPLERYLDAASARSRNHGDAQVEAAWEEALSELCDWAYEVFVHVLAGLRAHLPDEPGRRTPRVVLVPCGRLGIVPWHAARFPADAPYDYLCQALVISYAASGSQFLRTVRRAPRDPVSAPALVADPTLDLTFAELEVLELRNAFYPGARLYGDFGTLPPGSVPDGTPDQLLALLAQDHSMVHLATHGMAGVRPTESALLLAPTEPGKEFAPLTVTGLLDRPQPAGPAAPDGPLIVLSACETDLSTRDHDEALTLTTAFVSGGARDVVGSRWVARDGVSALLMAVFHHHLRAGLSPVDALRAAQLWMLDPDRKDPGRLSDRLRPDIGRPDLGRPALWAAFIHQGHPGRGRETV
ncbi:CHAT domain-containing protein [Streptomyces sp. NPDC007205]|uniref:CHAT domain-containing protein n=1 Tax=Streptomyces sp. NPDC007205 TaxID=3154316 RepID=UPI0033DF761C